MGDVFMVLNATQIRVGMVLNIEGELYRVTWTMHRTPGKGNACMQTKLKHLVTGKNLEMRFLSNDKVDKAELETRNMQYLYKEQGNGYVFMDNENFEQVTLEEDMLGELHHFLQEGTSYPVTQFQGQVVGIDFPKTVDIKVTSAPPEIKRATATNSMRPVTLENGLSINAPGFIKEGDVIRINTETIEYLERV